MLFFSPHDTPFEDGTFKLTIEFTEEYPNKPPTVRFVSKMFHPNGNPFFVTVTFNAVFYIASSNELLQSSLLLFKLTVAHVFCY